MTSTKDNGHFMISAENLTKKFDGFVAVDNVSFNVNSGEVFGFLGQNGAGKTTTMKMIYCFSPKTSGRLVVAGIDVDKNPRKIKEIIGVVPQENNLDPDFTVFENLITYSRYFNISEEVARKRTRRLLEFLQLYEKKDILIERLSTGMKRRLVLARALLNEPKMLILDEPTVGLDPQARHLIWQKLRELRREGITILITTHYMEEAEELCDRLVIMDNGKIITKGKPLDLIQKFIKGEVLELTTQEDIEPYLKKNYGNLHFEKIENRVHVFSEDPERLLRDIVARFRVESTLIRRATLEDVFLELTGRGLRE
jgi:lipooligosaccharide transport system ATP-binding protein